MSNIVGSNWIWKDFYYGQHNSEIKQTNPHNKTLVAQYFVGEIGLQKKVHESRVNFEKEVAQIIEKLYPDSKIKESVSNIGGKELPGEIDVMCCCKYDNDILLL